MTRALRRLLILFLLLGGAAWGLWYATRPEPVPVRLGTVAIGKVDSTVANTRAGTVKACRRSKLAPATGGQIAELPVHEGDRVKRGQVLLTIWNRDLEASVQLAEREAAAAKSRSEQSCLLAEVARREARRQVRLREQKLVSEEAVDRAVTDARAGEAACRAAQAAAEVSRAQVSLAQAELERTILKAPFDGVVAEVTGELGEFITPSPPGIPTPPAVDLIDDACLYVSAPIDEVDAPELRTGMPTCITLDAFPGRRCSGRLRRIAPYVQDLERQARTVEVEVEFTDPAEAQGLLVGYSADVEIILDTREGVLRVPTEAVLEGYRVLLLREAEGRLKELDFEAGLSNWEYTEVLSGLAQGDRVVVSVDREGVADGALARPDARSGR